MERKNLKRTNDKYSTKTEKFGKKNNDKIKPLLPKTLNNRLILMPATDVE